MRRIVPLPLVAFLVLAAFGVQVRPAAAQEGGGGDNVAVAVNTRDGSSVFRLAFSVRQVTDGVVDQTNAAVAYSSCTSCETVAIAIQVVLVSSDADVVSPTNLALAVNQDCASCVTAALASQLVLGVGEDLPLTGPIWGRIGMLRARFQRLRTTDWQSLEALQAEVDAITTELESILREAIAAPPPESTSGSSTTTTAGGGPTSSTTGSTTTSTTERSTSTTNSSSSTSTSTTPTSSSPASTATSSTATTQP